MGVVLPLTTTLEAGQEDLNSKIHNQPFTKAQLCSASVCLGHSKTDNVEPPSPLSISPRAVSKQTHFANLEKAWLGITRAGLSDPARASDPSGGINNYK